MLFNSYEFVLVFLPLTIIGYVLASRRSMDLGYGVLVVASLFFYSWWNVDFLWLLLASIGLNYLIGKGLAGA